MKVVVTGGSGRIGSAAAAALRRAGHEVLTLDIKPPPDIALPHRVINLTNIPAVRQVIEGYDAICHIGELPNIPNNMRHFCYATNTHIASGVMEAAVEVGMKKIIYTSTCQVYGCWGSENAPLVPPKFLPLDETHPLQPRNAYALSKVANEMYARLISDRTGLQVAAYRFPATHTAEGLMRSAFVNGSWHLEPARRDGFGTHLFVEDAGEAYLRGIESTWDGFEAFHFVADEVLSSIPVRDAVELHYPGVELPENWDRYASPVATDKAHRMLNWRPRHSLREKMLSAA